MDAWEETIEIMLLDYFLFYEGFLASRCSMRGYKEF